MLYNIIGYILLACRLVMSDLETEPGTETLQDKYERDHDSNYPSRIIISSLSDRSRTYSKKGDPLQQESLLRMIINKSNKKNIQEKDATLSKKSTLPIISHVNGSGYPAKGLNSLFDYLPVDKIESLTSNYKSDKQVSKLRVPLSNTKTNIDLPPSQNRSLNEMMYNSSTAGIPAESDLAVNGIFFVNGVAQPLDGASSEEEDTNGLKFPSIDQDSDYSAVAAMDNPVEESLDFKGAKNSTTKNVQENGEAIEDETSGECTKKGKENIKDVLFGENDIEDSLKSDTKGHHPGEKKEITEASNDNDHKKDLTFGERLVREIKFPRFFHATGILSLPYDNIQEPFEAWYAGGMNMSRIDYYYGMDKTYQRGDIGKHGVLVKLTPAHWNKRGSLDKNTYSCWFREEPKWSPQRGQSVIPLKLRKFKLLGEEMFNGVPAYKLQFQKRIYQKNNTYTFYVTKSKPHIPLRYEMVGFDHLLSSHYDNYVLDYITFKKWEYDFNILKIPKDYKCFKELKKLKSHYEANPMSEFLHDEEPGHREKETHKMFENYKKKHGKNYLTEEENTRRKDLFRHNSRFIHSKNRANLNYSLTLNELADVTDDEFEMYKGLRTDEDSLAIKREIDQLPMLRIEIPKEPLPETLDWRDYGAVTKVKSQSSCGACWSFSAVGAIEGAHSIQMGELEEFSEQQLIDCSWGYQNNGCRGGWSWRALNWMRDHGVATKASYGKYLGQEGYCHCDVHDNCTIVNKISYKTIEKHSKEKLKTALARYGPASLAVHCDRKTFKFFGSGIYDDAKCNHVTDHAVLIVGYGIEKNVPYWIIKNSWGVLWGDHGYIKIAMKNDLCGVLQNGALVVSMRDWKDVEKQEFPFKKMRKVNYDQEVEGLRKVSDPIQRILGKSFDVTGLRPLPTFKERES